jgi:hypothetical protein
MAKYKHTEEVKVVLDDLENRIQQLIEANELHIDKHGVDSDVRIAAQNLAFQSTLTLIKQVRDNGKVMRGNEFFPDPIEPIVTTKFAGKQQLGV